MSKKKEQNNNLRTKVMYGIALVAMFAVGFGTGQSKEKDKQSQYLNQPNYTTNQPSSQNSNTNPTTPQDTTTPKTPNLPASQYQSQTKVDPSNCLIKGNISASGSKIYHMEGGAFYEKTNPEECFNSEEEAVKAGFRKSLK